MKKIGNFFRAVSFSIITLCMVFAMAVVPFINQNSYRANAAESSKTYTTDYYTLSYENNEVKLLLNSDLRVYQNLSKNDLRELKNAIVSVGYSAIFDDVSTTTTVARNAKVRRVAPVNRMQNGVDISNVNNVIEKQLVDVESIEDAVYGEKYNVLLEFYVDRYASVYAETNPGTTYEEVVSEISSQLVNNLQPIVDSVYEAEGMLEEAPLVSTDWIDGVVENVLTNNANGTNIQLTLDDVSSVLEIIDDSNTIVSVINELDVVHEMSSIVKSSSSDEITNFFVTLDMDTIIDVFNCVEISKEDVKDIISSVGPDCFFDITEIVGADKMADLAHALEFTKSDLNEIIKDNVSSVSLTSILKTFKSIRVDGRVIFEDTQFKMDGLKYLIKSLPRPSEVANYSDDQMKLSWNLDFDTIFGDVDFKLTVGFMGDCSLIRSAAREIAEIVDFTIEDGVYTINVKAPAKLSKILLRACNTGVIPDNFKQTIFNNLSASVDEIYNKIVDKTFDQYLDYLKEIDYKTILANLYNAENLNDLFGTNKFTDARLDKFVDEVCHLVSKASNLTYDRVRDFVCRYVDISVLDDTKIETLIDKTFALLRKIDSLSLDSALLREFIDPESQYTNENIYNYIDKLSNYENYFDLLMKYFKKAYEVLPNRIKDNDLLDFYRGNGVFNYTGTINLNYESFLNRLSSQYGDKMYDALSVLFDRLPSSINVNLTASFVDTYKVSYHIGDTVKEGLLPVGANLEFFAQTPEIEGYSVVKWIDNEGNAYTAMPAFDVELYAVTDFDVIINHDELTVDKTYDGEAYTLEVSVAPENNYTYQWYKNGTKIDGAIYSTYDVVDVIDSASYYCEVSTPLMSKVSETVDVSITPAEIDLSELTWSDSNFTYDGSEHSVTLTNVPEQVSVSYEENKATNAGEYVATATATLTDSNYVLVGEVEDLTWTIAPAEIDLSNVTWSESEFTYDGTEHSVTLVNLPENVNVVYTNNTATNAGEYTAVANVTPINSNYVLVGEVEDLTWTVAPAEIDLSDLTWGESEFTYDGNEHSVTLTNVPEQVSVSYEGNKATNAGEYVATATATLTDSNYVLVGKVEDLTWTINPAKFDASTLKWEDVAEFTYDGTEHSVTLVNNYPSYIEVVKYEGNTGVNAGEYTASVVVRSTDSNYVVDGVAPVKKWTINPAEFDISNLSWNYNNIPFVYNGEVKEVTLKDLPEFVVDVVYENNTGVNVGEYTARAVSASSSNPNYVIVGETELVWNIEKAIVDGSDFVWNYHDSTEYVYDGKLKVVNLDLVPSFVEIEYTGVYKATNAGEYNVTAKVVSSENYEVNNFEVATLTWNIAQQVVDLSNVTWSESEFTYDGRVHFVTLMNLPEGVDVEYTNNTAVNAGEYTASVVATPVNDNYALTGSVSDLTWNIAQQVVDLSDVTWGESEFTYDGTKHEVVLSNLPENVYVSYTSNSAIDAGEYTASAVITPVNDNYVVTGSVSDLTWNIAQQVVDLSNVTWSESEFTYDGAEHSVTLVNVPENVVVSYTNNSGVSAKEYTASVVVTPANNNYVITGSVNDLTWEIKKAVIDLSNVTWSESEFTYDGLTHLVELVGLPSDVQVSYSGNAGINAGHYTAKASITLLNDNYVVEGSVNDLTWEIKKAVIDLSNVAWSESEFTYDGTVHAVSLVNLPNYVNVSYTGNTATNAGSYTAKATVVVDDNYTVSKNIEDLTWKIEKQKVNVSNVSWSPASFTYDGNEKEVFVMNVPANVTPVYANTTKAINAGDYTASVSFKTKSDNYVVEGTVSDLTWKINPVEFDASTLKWNYTHYFTADGKTTYTVELVDVPSFLIVTYTNNSSDKVGEYVAKAGVNAKDKNYVIANSVSDLTWKIVEKVDVVDPSTTKHELVKTVDGVVVVSIDALTGVGKNDDIMLNTNVEVKDVDLSSILAEDEVGNIVTVYDISIVDENQNKMSYSDVFTVSMLIPEAYRGNNNLRVVYIDENNKVTNMHGSVEGDYMVFGTTHFSKYALVEVAPKEAPKSLNWLIWLLVAIIVILIVIILLLIFRKPKEDNETTVVAPIVEEVETSNNYIVVKDNKIVEEKLNEAKDNDLIAPTTVKDYAVGMIENGNVSVFKELRPIRNSYGKVNKNENGEVAINLYKDVVRVVAKFENPNVEKIIVEHSNVNDDVKIELNATANEIAIKKNIVKVELGEVVNSDENVVVRIHKTPKSVD